jgi:predicted SnoaL-like aldol condensation-catalyzing enzyme
MAIRSMQIPDWPDDSPDAILFHQRGWTVTIEKERLTMASSDVEKVMALFEGIANRDPSLAIKHVNPTSYTNHNPLAYDGIEGVRGLIAHLPGGKSPLKVVRAFQDGPYVFTHSEGDFFGQKVFFDIFKLEDGQIVEHWDSSTERTPPNESGHTQTDGPTQAEHLEDREKNKSLIRDFYETCFVRGNFAKIHDYFSADRFIRHDSNGGDGLSAFLALMKAGAQRGVIFKVDEIKFVLGQGDFVLVAAKGSISGKSCVYYDLFRVESGKIAEHWGIIETVPAQEKWNNRNGIL